MVLVAQHALARRLALAHLLGMAPIELGLGLVRHQSASLPAVAERREQGMSMVGAGPPEAAFLRLQQPLGKLAQRRRVRIGHEVPHIVVRHVGVEHRVEMVVLHGAGGGGEGEEVVDRRGDLEGALVAVPHDALDPLRVVTRARTTRPSSSASVRMRGLSGTEWSL